MNPTFELVRSQTITFRKTIASIASGLADVADEIPPTWNNNVRWHIGHLVVTPHLLTYGLLGEPIGLPEQYRGWFAKGTSPLTWGDDPVPPFDQLLMELESTTLSIFDAFASRADAAYKEPYKTTPGVVLPNVTEALCFSQAHDGIHVGLLFALKRALKS